MPYCTVTDVSDPTTPGGTDYVTYNAATGGNVGNGTNPGATASIDTDNKYVEWQIPFTQNGHYQLDCTVTNGAGVTATLATQTIEVDQTSTTDLQSAAQQATNSSEYAVDASPAGDSNNVGAANYVSTVSQSAAPWSGDPLTFTYSPAEARVTVGTTNPSNGDWPATADATDPPRSIRSSRRSARLVATPAGVPKHDSVHGDHWHRADGDRRQQRHGRSDQLAAAARRHARHADAIGQRQRRRDLHRDQRGRHHL